MVPRENENNAYVKFGGTNKEYHGIFRNDLYRLSIIDTTKFARSKYSRNVSILKRDFFEILNGD